jgi:hypothetical protein
VKDVLTIGFTDDMNVELLSVAVQVTKGGKFFSLIANLLQALS